MKFLIALLVVFAGSFWSAGESVAQKTMKGYQPQTKQTSKPFLGLMFDKMGVTKVMENSPAEKAGFKVGDVLVNFDGEAVTEIAAVANKMAAMKAGDSIELVVKRNGEELKVPVVLGDMKDAPSSTHTSDKHMQSGTVEFASADGLEVTMDIYAPHTGSVPSIVLCHQAGWSRGEYQEIAPKLNKMGFNCYAIDQRSGGGVNDVLNETNKRAAAAGKGVQYPDAEQDIVAALKKVKGMSNQGTVILWGSSYSAALSLRIAGEHPELVDGVLAFAPGEYFGRLGKPNDWIATSAKKIKVPAFITSAKNEKKNWISIYEAIPGQSKAMFLPETKGNHGSRALWAKFDDNAAYWTATKSFLTQFNNSDSDVMKMKAKKRAKIDDIRK